MIWGYIFIALIIFATTYVLTFGDCETRWAMLTLVGGTVLTVLTVYLTGQYYQTANPLVMLVDFLVYIIFLVISLKSRRHWTIGLPALQLIVCLTHVAKLVAPDIVPRAYVIAQGHWSYYQIALIVASAHLHRGRRRILKRWAERRKALGRGADNV